MAKTDLASRILKEMESGVSDLYRAYQSRIRTSGERYDSLKQEIAADTEEKKRLERSASAIRLKNSLEKLAEQGLAASGGAMQTRLSENAALAGALSKIEASGRASENELLREKEKERAELEEKQASALTSYRTQMMKSYLDQLNADRDREAENAKINRELSLKARSIALQEQKYKNSLSSASASSSSSSSSGAKNAETGIVPKKTPYEYLDEIVAKYTTRDPNDRRYKLINKGAIAKTLNTLVRDVTLAESYRKELYLYAKTMGYLN